jgi:PAS domain S-box-containing protein
MNESIILPSTHKTYCPNCAKPIKKGAAFCSNCGFKVKRQFVANNQEESEKNIKELNKSFKIQTAKLLSSNKKLKEKLNEIELIYKYSPVGLAILDENLRYIKVNKKLAEIHGISAAKHIGKTIREVIPDMAEASEPIAQQVIKTGKPLLNIEITRESKTKPGVKRYMIEHWYPLKNPEGKILNINAIVEITHIKETEEKIKRYAEKLKAVNIELEAFSYSVSHDLRGPIRSIDGYAKLLTDELEGKLNNVQKDYFNRIRNSAQKLSSLLDDMQKLFNVTKTIFNIDNVNLSSIAESIGQSLKEKNPQRAVEFIIKDGITVKGDETMLKIVFTNLMENALKFAKNGQKALIEFGVLNSTAGITYFIKDNGIGFDQKYSDKLFKPFSRLHTDETINGTGIGLSIVERIIERHGGKIWAEGEKNKGAIFYFTLSEQR